MYVGARDPEFAEIVIADAEFDFATVTSAELEVETPGPTETLSWDWSLDTSIPGQITLTHVFAADGSDVPRVGPYIVTGWLLTPASRRRVDPVRLTADPYR